MADTISNVTVMNTAKRLVVRSDLTCDGTPSTDLVAVDKSAFTGPNGAEPSKFVVEAIEWSLSGVDAIVEFDHTADDLIAQLAGSSASSGRIDFTQEGKYQGFVDPASAGATGDIVVTTANSAAGDTGSIIFYLRKKD